MARRETIHDIFQMLLTAYPHSEINSSTPQLYLRFLEDLPDEILEAAVLQHISSSPFFPRVSELRELAAGLAMGFDKIQPAAAAWGEVCRLILAYGHDRRPEIENPIAEQTVEAMGWRNLCFSTNQISDRARFIETYNAYLQRAKREAVTIPAVRQLAARLRAPGTPAGQITSCIEINQVAESDIDNV